MPISEVERHRAERTLRMYCDAKRKPEVAHLLQIVYRLEGNYAHVSERRPDWQDPSVIHDHDVAKFRFFVNERRWALFWRDRNLKWHLFEDCEPSADIGDLLPVVDREPIFYG